VISVEATALARYRIVGRPLEESVSRRAILARYAMLTDRVLGPGEDVRDIAERARGGEAAASAVFGEAFETLGWALGPWLTRFGATVLVVGGAVTNSWDLVSEPLATGLRTADPTLPNRVAVVRGQLGNDAALIGAAQHAAASSQRSRVPDARSVWASGPSAGVSDT
jgi:glucokinase